MFSTFGANLVGGEGVHPRKSILNFFFFPENFGEKRFFCIFGFCIFGFKNFRISYFYDFLLYLDNNVIIRIK